MSWFKEGTVLKKKTLNQQLVCVWWEKIIFPKERNVCFSINILDGSPTEWEERHQPRFHGRWTPVVNHVFDVDPSLGGFEASDPEMFKMNPFEEESSFGMYIFGGFPY